MLLPRIIEAVDVQVTGETGRILFDQTGMVKGDDMAAKLAYCRTHLTTLRHAVLREPRGHPNLMGVIVTPPVEPTSDFGVIIMEQADFAPMSGANLMCAVTAALETGHVAATEPTTTLRIDTASGPLAVSASVADGRVIDIKIENVASFAVAIDAPLEIPGFGVVPVDVSFGGQFYVLASAEAFGVPLDLEYGRQLVRAGNLLLATAREHFEVKHPNQPYLAEIQLPILYGTPQDAGIDARSTVVMPLHQPDLADPASWDAGTLDRSPGGTGTCARMAAEYAKGNIALRQEFVQQSLLGTTFTGRLEYATDEHGYTMLQPTLRGRGWIVGQHQLIFAEDDPFPVGFVM